MHTLHLLLSVTQYSQPHMTSLRLFPRPQPLSRGLPAQGDVGLTRVLASLTLTGSTLWSIIMHK